jgi:hypothetical protein
VAAISKTVKKFGEQQKIKKMASPNLAQGASDMPGKTIS